MPPAASWNPPRAKIQLKLSIQRIRLLAAKKSQLAKVTRREIAGFLEKGKIETARIKVEGVLGEDTMVDLLEILELYCELLLARFGLLETVREVDPGVSEAVSGVIFAAGRTELKELHTLRDMLMSKYGRDYSLEVLDNVDGCVSTRVTSKLAIAQPPAETVDAYLHEIAKAYAVDWKPDSYIEPEAPSVRYHFVIFARIFAHVLFLQSTPIPTALSLPTSDPILANAIPSTPTKPHPAALVPFPQTPPVDPQAAPRTVVIHTNLPSPGVTVPPAPVIAAPTAKVSEQDAFDALTRRFAELKKR
ncbi:vacuolar protein sorting-associated protein IST1, partial [Phenoliferia sp. Uapishka_3]